MEDHQIIDLYWARNEQAITASDAKYGPYCRTVARNILWNEQDGEECVNDTWHRAWESMPPQRPSLLRAFLAPSPATLPLTAGKSSMPKSGAAASCPLRWRSCPNVYQMRPQWSRQ